MAAAFSLVDDQPDFILINKAPDISFHREGEIPGIIERVKEVLDLPELYPVHRLDRMTSGLLLLAKNEQSNRALSALFRERNIEKYYLALSDKKPKKKQGKVVGDLVKSRGGSYRLSQSRINPSITQFFSSAAGAGVRAFLLKPHTGKTHQLRVVMKSLGAPIIGDSRYGEIGHSSDRGYLHAYALRFSLNGHCFSYCVRPEQGELFNQTFFQALSDTWEQPWLLPWP